MHHPFPIDVLLIVLVMAGAVGLILAAIVGIDRLVEYLFRGRR